MHRSSYESGAGLDPHLSSWKSHSFVSYVTFGKTWRRGQKIPRQSGNTSANSGTFGLRRNNYNICEHLDKRLLLLCWEYHGYWFGKQSGGKKKAWKKAWRRAHETAEGKSVSGPRQSAKELLELLQLPVTWTDLQQRLNLTRETNCRVSRMSLWFRLTIKPHQVSQKLGFSEESIRPN